jgi:drug/metabolite transporter (DMT)-like permease
MSEPLIAAGIAWVWLGQSLSGVQMLGAAVTLTGIAVIQFRRTPVPMSI